MTQEGSLQSSVMITVGPCWHNAGPILPISTIRCWQLEMHINYIVTSCMESL